MKENLKYTEEPRGQNGGSPEAGINSPDEVREAGIASEEPVKPVKKANKGRRAVQDFLGGDYLSKEWVTGNLVYILYLGLLAMIYIGNTYYTEKKFKNIERTKNDLKELRFQYITTKSILMFQGRQSEISKRALINGLKETTMPPYKILYSGESLKARSK
ncbi:MAG: FtsL-like putative cell division protein [Bacteroidota bacterium]